MLKLIQVFVSGKLSEQPSELSDGAEFFKVSIPAMAHVGPAHITYVYERADGKLARIMAFTMEPGKVTDTFLVALGDTTMDFVYAWAESLQVLSRWANGATFRELNCE